MFTKFGRSKRKDDSNERAKKNSSSPRTRKRIAKKRTQSMNKFRGGEQHDNTEAGKKHQGPRREEAVVLRRSITKGESRSGSLASMKTKGERGGYSQRKWRETAAGRGRSGSHTGRERLLRQTLR